MASITLEEVSKTYPNGYKAVSSLSLEVADGEFMVLVGPSGCGKTTLLRMIAGLEDITEGVMRIDDKVVNELSPKDRDVAMVFQNYALYPHMTVAENIGFALKLRKVPKAQIKVKVEQAAAILGLTEWLDRKPAQLSGGQRQRVAMGRAIVREPSIFLMDEPLSNLDAKLRVQMRAEVSRIQRQVGVATVYVTHDQTEAMTMGDRVAVLRGGVLQQCDAPQVLYDRPANMFVGAFIGSPAMNLYEAQVSTEAKALRLGSQEVPLEESVLLRRRGLSRYGGRSVVVGFRPENLSVGPGPGPSLVGEVELVESLGAEMLVHFKLDARRVIAEGAVDDEADSVLLAGEGIARVDPRAEVKPGKQATFRVDMAYAHFFDPDSGEAIWN